MDAGTEFMEALKIFRGTEYQIDIAEAQKNLGVRAIETGGVLLHCLVTVPLTWMVRPLVGSGQWSFANGLPGRLPVLCQLYACRMPVVPTWWSGVAFVRLQKVYTLQHRCEEAKALYESALAILRHTIGDIHPIYGDTLAEMGVRACHSQMRRLIALSFAKAIPRASGTLPHSLVCPAERLGRGRPAA